MTIIQELDIYNPFQMGDLLSDEAWDNLYLLQKNCLLGTLERILEDLYQENMITLDQLEEYLKDEVYLDFPEVFESEENQEE